MTKTNKGIQLNAFIEIRGEGNDLWRVVALDEARGLVDAERVEDHYPSGWVSSGSCKPISREAAKKRIAKMIVTLSNKLGNLRRTASSLTDTKK